MVGKMADQMAKTTVERLVELKDESRVGKLDGMKAELMVASMVVMMVAELDLR